jgi:predicted nuclease of predicted toxin-antitoxin system
MRILLDECVNERLRNYFRDQDVQSARYAGFSGLKNGELLDAAESAGFDVLLTVDRGFGHQQNLAGRKIAVLILRTKSIALEELIRHVPECLAALRGMKPGDTAEIPRDGE